MYKGNIELKDIIIPDVFLTRSPREKKIQQRIDFYRRNNSFPRLVVREDTKKLIDGYASYCAAKQLNLKVVTCSIITATEAIHYQSPVKSKSDTISKRDKVADKKGRRCYICGRDLFNVDDKNYDGTNEFTLDHKIPLFKGGTNAIDNIFPCCNICNGLKGDFSYSHQLRRLIIRELIERGILPKSRMPKDRNKR